MSTIGQEIIAKVRARAEANPDFVYEPRINDEPTLPYGSKTCMYVRDAQPSCLIGCGLWDADLIGPELEEDPTVNEENMPINESPADHLFDYLDLDLSNVELVWLATVQGAQDRGDPWAKAVRSADSCYPAVSA